MKKLLHHHIIIVISLSIAFCLLPIVPVSAQPPPSIEWQKSLGGSDWDVGRSFRQTADGGYIITGSTGSNDGNVSGNHGNDDYWVVKIDSIGTLQWQKCLGGTLGDYGESIQNTTDGGYIVAGRARSNDGDVSGNHGNFDMPGRGNELQNGG